MILYQGNVVINLPLPTSFQPAPYSPPTACLSNSTGDLKPSSTPSMWIVSLDMVTPFQPRRIAPFGDGNGFERPNSFTCSAEGVTVGSLKMAPIFAPAAAPRPSKSGSLVWRSRARAAQVEELPGARVDVGLEPVLQHQLGGVPRHLFSLDVDHRETLDLALGGEAVT